VQPDSWKPPVKIGIKQNKTLCYQSKESLTFPTKGIIPPALKDSIGALCPLSAKTGFPATFFSARR
jgi:hypothetical protein